MKWEESTPKIVSGIRDESDETFFMWLVPGETILEAAERQGVSLPFGCRYGVCGTCTAQLVEGRVVHQRPPSALKPVHIRRGYLLPCVASPLTDCQLRVGARIQAEMIRNPFKSRRSSQNDEDETTTGTTETR